MTFSVNDKDRLWRDPQQNGWFRFPGPLRYILFLLVLIGFVIGLWYFLPFTHQTINKTELPLIRADDDPFKIKAEDQGVPGIRHQDKLVYGRIRNDQSEPSVEHILPDPEPPHALLREETPTVKMIEEYMPNDGEFERISERGKQPSSPELNSIEALLEEMPLPEKIIPTEKAKIFIQLGSLKSYDLAEAEWTRLAKKHTDLLGKSNPVIQKVDQGADLGILYRLRTGAFENVEKAQAICKALKERKVDCLVIH